MLAIIKVLFYSFIFFFTFIQFDILFILSLLCMSSSIFLRPTTACFIPTICHRSTKPPLGFYLKLLHHNTITMCLSKNTRFIWGNVPIGFCVDFFFF